jgi:hypothetical protein
MYFHEKNDAAKKLGPFNVYKVHETQKDAKTESCSQRYDKNKGDFLENHRKQCKTCPEA